MPTHIFRTSAVLTLLQLLSASLAATTYTCNSEAAPKFHQDCAVATNQLILSLTRSDGQVHIPNDEIYHTFGSCKAGVDANGGEKVVPASEILLSFAQIGSRCQDGSFSYDGGSITGSLKGHANWKRNTRRDQESWSDKNEKRDVNNIPPKYLQPRSQMIGARRGSDGKVYELVFISGHGVPEIAPSSEKLYDHGQFYQRAREFIDHHKTRADAVDIVFGNAYQIGGGSHVSLVSLGVSLRGGQKSWKEFVEGMNDHAKALKELVKDATWHYVMNGYVAGYYKVVTNTGSEVLGVLLYGYDSVDSALPS